jgi:hypothetical protein
VDVHRHVERAHRHAQAERERRERRIAEEATEPAEERTAVRRADKAAYLKEKLQEREESER